jgi:hypothetical protein
MALEIRDDYGDVVVETRPVWKKRRYLIVLLAFFGFINIYTLRYVRISHLKLKQVELSYELSYQQSVHLI